MEKQWYENHAKEKAKKTEPITIGTKIKSTIDKLWAIKKIIRAV